MKRLLTVFILICLLVPLASGCAAGAGAQTPPTPKPVTAGTPAGAENETNADDHENTLDSLAGKRFGVGIGTVYDEVVRERWPDAQILYYETDADQLIALQQGKIDAFVIDQPLARQYLLKATGLTQIPETLMPDAYGVVFQKNEDGARLRDDFNAFLRTAEEGRLLETLEGIWFGADETQKTVASAASLPAVNGTLRYAAIMEAEPFCYYKDGQPVGFEVDLITRFCEARGCGLEIATASFGALLPGIVSGRYDVVSSTISITEERAQSVHFSDPIYQGGIVVIVPAATAAGDEDAGFFASLSESFRKNFIVENRWKLIVSGIGVTLLLSVCSGVVGILIGFGLCLMRLSRYKAPDAAARTLTRVLQGTPIVVLLMILYYVVFNKTGLDGVSVAVIAFGLNFGAYASEIMRSGILAVDRGQREAAAAMGYSGRQTFLKIVFPQAARHFLPVLKGEYISLVKMTSIVGYVAVQDLTKMGDIIRSRTYEAFFPLIVTAVIYFLLSFGLSSLLRLVELRVDPQRRPRTVKGVELR